MKSVKNIFVYGTLMSGQVNHKYFKQSISNIKEAYINADLYHLIDYDCPTIVKGDNKVYGQLITYQDFNDEIEQALDYLEHNFGKNHNLNYNKEEIIVYIGDEIMKSKTYVLKDYKDLNKTQLKGRWNNN